MRRRLAVLGLGALTLAGCDPEPQPAVPYVQSIPVALALLVLPIALVARLSRPRQDVRPGAADLPWWRRILSAVMVVPVALGAVWLAFGAWWVATAYHEQRDAVFSWGDTVIALCLFLVPGIGAAVIQLRASLAVLDGRRWGLVLAAVEVLWPLLVALLRT